MKYSLIQLMRAHYHTRLPLLLWGSSGYGKTQSVAEFARISNFDLKILHAQFLDPYSLFIPDTQNMRQNQSFTIYPAQFLRDIFEAKRPTVLFLDELTRASQETFNILTELLLDRKVFGYHIPDNVLIVAASNYAEEDTGVRELPDAVLQRLTHLDFNPTQDQIISGMQNPRAKAILRTHSSLVAKPQCCPIFDRLKANPRNIDAVATLADYGLRGEDLKACAVGRIGLEKGLSLAAMLEQNSTAGDSRVYPDKMELANFEVFAKLESVGEFEYVANFICSPKTNPEVAATYLVYQAQAATCQIARKHGFEFIFKKPPHYNDMLGVRYLRPNGATKNFAESDVPWTVYAQLQGKL